MCGCTEGFPSAASNPPTVRRSAMLALLALLILAAAPQVAAAACDQPTPLQACELWTARFNSATPGLGDVEADFGNDVVVSADGATTFVTGRIRGMANIDDFDVGTLAYDTDTGARRWFARYPGGTYYDFGQALAVDPDGERVYVAGSTHDGDFDAVVIAYDAGSGQEVWSTVLEGAGFADLAADLALSDDGETLAVAGESWRPAGSGPGEDQDMLTVALDASDGRERWRAVYDGGAVDRAQAVDVGPDLGVDTGDPGPVVVVTGPSARPGDPAAIATVAYDLQTGARRWAARLEAPTAQEGRDLEIAPDGRTVVVAGNRAGAGTNLWDYVTVAYDVDGGGERWQRVFDGPTSSLDQVSSMTLSPDGSSAFVTGVSWNMKVNGPVFVNEANYLTFAYDVETGEERWRSLYDGGFESDDVGTAIAASPDGSTVYVGGHSRIPGVWTYATVALRADTGTQEWSARLGGGDGVSSEGPKVSVGPDGRVFVTGSGLGKDWYDVLTVAYQG